MLIIALFFYDINMDSEHELTYVLHLLWRAFITGASYSSIIFCKRRDGGTVFFDIPQMMSTLHKQNSELFHRIRQRLLLLGRSFCALYPTSSYTAYGGVNTLYARCYTTLYSSLHCNDFHSPLQQRSQL